MGVTDEVVRYEDTPERYSAGQSKVPLGYKQTQVGLVPCDWDVANVGDVARVKGGKRLPPGFVLVDSPTPHPYIRVSDMRPGGVSVSTIKYVPRPAFPPIQRYRIYKDDIFISVAGTLGIVGVVPKALDGANLTENADCITDIRCDRDYLKYWLMSRSIQDTIESIRTVGAQPKLALGRIARFEFALPRRSQEQRLIAQALSDVDELLTAVDALIVKKQALKQAAMQQLLTGKIRLPGFSVTEIIEVPGLGTLPADWFIPTLDEVCIKIQDGTHFSPKPGGSDRLYVTSRNVGFGTLDLSDAEMISEEEHRKIYSRCDTRLGDLLLTKDGANTGNAALNTLQDECSLLSSVAFMRFDSRRDDVRFFLQYILSNAGQRRLKEIMSGNAITRLTLKKIKNFRVPRPSFDEQQAIATMLSDMDTEVAAFEGRRDKVRDIKQGMMQQLLTGRVRLVKPTPEKKAA